jgi:preprotein translocase SecE subunit
VTQRAAAAPGAGPPGRAADEEPDRLPAPRARSFVAESWAELKKVEWPGQAQVIQATVVVLIACIVVGAYLYFNDLIWKPSSRDSSVSNEDENVPLVRHQHLLRAREQGEGQSRAPDHLDEPGSRGSAASWSRPSR